MWLLIAIALVVGALFAVSIRAWISILVHETDRHDCPSCKSRMALAPSKGATDLAFQCSRCGESLPFAADQARRLLKGTREKV